MKATSFLLVAALVSPAAVFLGLNAAIVASITTAVAISTIALGDYGKPALAYRTAADAKRSERHPLAA